MPHPRLLLLVVVALFACLVGCSSDDDEGNQQPPPQNQPDGGHSPPDVFTGNCTTARWSNVSDACWTCMCDACAATLNACDDACARVFECTIAKKTLVNVGSEIACEIRGTVAECLTDPASQGAAQALISFDGCLISSPKPSGFRVCEDVCELPYPGDVCTRYPQ